MTGRLTRFYVWSAVILPGEQNESIALKRALFLTSFHKSPPHFLTSAIVRWLSVCLICYVVIFNSLEAGIADEISILKRMKEISSTPKKQLQFRMTSFLMGNIFFDARRCFPVSDCYYVTK